IARGLAEGERVLLTLPPGHEKLKLARLPAADAAKPASVTAGATTPPPTPTANQDRPVRWDREALARLRGRISARLGFSVRTAVEAVRHNKLRASLTSLGILFGVASVIAMLAIGKGAEREILEQMRLLGSNNVVITPLVE